MAKPVLRIIIGSTRPGRVGPSVAAWITERAIEHGGFDVQVTDLAELNLPLLDEPNHPRRRQYTKQHTKDWSALVDASDAFIFVTPEYNYGFNAALKNAIDYLYREWNNKSVGFVGYGGNGGARAVEILRQVVSNVELADVRAQVGLSLFTDFENFTTFKPGPHLEPTVTGMLDQVIAWGGALKPLRAPKSD